MASLKIILVANTDWYLFNFRLEFARHLRSLGYDVLLVSPPGRYVERMQAEGFRWLPIPFSRRSINPLTEWAPVLALSRLYRAEAPDLVHHFTIKPVIYGSLAARLSGIRAVVNAVTGMGVVYSSRSRILLRSVVDNLLRMAMQPRNSQLILQNPDDVSVFRRRCLAQDDRIHLIRGSGVDGNVFKPRPSGRRRSDCRVLFAARLIKPKGVHHFAQIGQRYAERENVHFLVAGNVDDGNPEAVALHELERWENKGWIELLGHVENMAATLAECDIVVHPSSYGEGVPRILVEAAATGLPLVAFDVAGSREIVINDKNGFLVPVGNQEALERAVEQLIESTELRHRMGEYSRRHFETEYDQNMVFEKTLRVYECALTD